MELFLKQMWIQNKYKIRKTEGKQKEKESESNIFLTNCI